VLDGKREVAEKFFIDPLTGISYPTNSPQFLGIESMWNNKNYWVNMQICTEGVQVRCTVPLSLRTFIFFVLVCITRPREILAHERTSFIIVQELVYDLDDCTLWEFVFPGGEKSTLLLPEDDDDMMGDDDEVTVCFTRCDTRLTGHYLFTIH
jgi:hypothetical protein